MKIALACRVYPTHRPGGMPFVVQDRARALAALGHDVHVLTTSKDGKSSQLDDKGVTVHHTNSPECIYSAAFADECVKYCKAIVFDIVHCDSMNTKIPWWKDVKGYTACTMHGFSWGSFLTQWNMYRIGLVPINQPPQFKARETLEEVKALNSFGSVIAISKHECQILKKEFGLRHATVVYNPIPDYFFVDKKPLPAQRMLVCAAISGKKERLFDMAKSSASRANIPLSIVSKVPRTQMPRMYDMASALVVPTAYSQGYDLTIAESLARGRPVIVSDVGSAVMEAEGQTGIVVTALGDQHSLIKAMSGTLPVVDDQAARAHVPKYHAEKWLEAVKCRCA